MKLKIDKIFKIDLKSMKMPKHIITELSLMTILFCMGITVFALDYKKDQDIETYRNLQVEALTEQVNQLTILSDDLMLERDKLNEAYQMISTESAILENEAWDSALKLYQDIQLKYDDYSEEGVDLSPHDEQMQLVLDNLLDGNYEAMGEKVTELDKEFEKLLLAKVEADKKKAEEEAKRAASAAVVNPPVSNSPGSGYSRITVNTEKGNFVTSIVLVDMGQVEVVTVTGQDGNCDNECTTKSLANYVSENSGFAGMNGTYFCPPDYASCSGKVNSYDFPVYNSQHNKWINDDKLFWNDRGMMAWSGTSNWFCGDAKSCNVGVTAGIVNYPSLINNEQIIVPSNLPSYLKDTRGYRGAVGTNGNWLYLMHVRGATVPDVAYVMKSLGIKNGLNLDGGGSSAMYYNGRYVIGPGRSLPNALVLRYR